MVRSVHEGGNNSTEPDLCSHIINDASNAHPRLPLQLDLESCRYRVTIRQGILVARPLLRGDEIILDDGELELV